MSTDVRSVHSYDECEETMRQGSDRLEFSERVRQEIFRDAGYICANPDCRSHLHVHDSYSGRTIFLGEAGHIYAASAGGPRYDENQPESFIISRENGLCLCKPCHFQVDQLKSTYTVQILKRWRENSLANNRPEFNRRISDLGQGRSMGDEVETLKKYVREKLPQVRLIEDFLYQARVTNSFSELSLPPLVGYALNDMEGIAFYSKSYEITYREIQERIFEIKQLAAAVNRERTLNTRFTGGARIIRDSTNMFLGHPREVPVYNDHRIEKMNELVKAFKDLDRYCDALETKTFTR